jgi:hypothetical protein
VAGQQIPVMERRAVSTMSLQETRTHQPHYNMVSQPARQQCENGSLLQKYANHKYLFLRKLCNVPVNIFISET